MDKLKKILQELAKFAQQLGKDAVALFKTTPQLLKGYLGDRSIAFFVALGAAVLSIIVAILYASGFGAMPEYMAWHSFWLLLLGGILFVGLSLYRFSKIGAVLMTLFDFIALIGALRMSYGYVLAKIVETESADVLTQDSACLMFVVSAVIMVLCCLIGNAATWLRLHAKPTAQNN